MIFFEKLNRVRFAAGENSRYGVDGGGDNTFSARL